MKDLTVKDLTEFALTGGTEEDLRRILAEAQPYQSPPEAPKTNGTTPHTKETKPQRKPLSERVIDLADVQPPTDLPLLFGQYLLKGAAHWLTGQTGLGKSTLLFNIATALAEGNDLWEIECPQTRILYCDMESGDVGRAHKIERLYQDTPRVRGQLLFLREPVKLPEELPELLAFVQEKEISLVIFDTARRVFSVKDENDNAETYNRVVPTLDALKQIGVASLTMGHPSKNGNGSARGAGAQEDAGDVNLSLTMHRGEVSDKDGVIALRVTKNRLLGLGIPPLFLKRIGGDQFERIDSGETEPQEEPVSKQLQCREFLIETLRASEAALTHKVLLTKAQAANFSKATFERAFKQMKDDGDAQTSGAGYTHDPFAKDEAD